MDQVITFVLAIVSLVVLGAAFAFIFYLLIRSRLGKINTLTVTQEGIAEPLAGIPFYIKQGRITHETSYLETLATLTLTGEKVEMDDQGKVAKKESDFVGVRTVTLSPEMVTAIARLQSDLNRVRQAQFCSKQVSLWESAKNAFANLNAYVGLEPGYVLPLEKNTLTESTFVDYDTRLYLNKIQPLSGSSDLDISLAPDGTLTKALGKTTESTFEKLLGVMPKADSLLDKGKAAVSDGDAGTAHKQGDVPRDASLEVPTEKCQLQVSLTVENHHVRHIWFKHVTHRSYLTPAVWAQDGYWYRREIVAEAEPHRDALASTTNKDG